MLKEFISNEDEAKRALLGTIIADGHICQARETAYIDRTYVEITHTSKSLDYIKAKKELFESISGIKCSIKEHNKHTEKKDYLLFRLTTNSVPYYVELRNQLYVNKVKIFPKEIIDQYTDLSLLLMYLDDGCLKVRFYPGTDKLREARIEWALHCFTYDELKYFTTWLKEQYDVEFKIYKALKSKPNPYGYVIWTNTTNTRKFMKIIDKYYEAVPSMKYKFLKYYSL